MRTQTQPSPSTSTSSAAEILFTFRPPRLLAFSKALLALCLFLLAPRLACASEAFTGQWVGSYTNSVGESGNDSLFLTETPDGRLSGKWTGTIPISGRRINANTAQLRAGTAKRSYQITLVIQGNTMTLKYVATRLDSAGAYEGVAKLRRQ